MVTTLSTFEAIDACVDYHGENCTFDCEQKIFIYTGRGWGSPVAIYNALYDGKKNHHYRGKPYAFKLRQFKDALASGALVLRGRRVPIKSARHSKIQPAETVYLEFDAVENCARHNGEIAYVELQFIPKSEFLSKIQNRRSGRPSMEAIVMALHGQHKNEIRPDTTLERYAKTLQNSFWKKNKKENPPSLSVIKKHLKKNKVFSHKYL